MLKEQMMRQIGSTTTCLLENPLKSKGHYPQTLIVCSDLPSRALVTSANAPFMSSRSVC